VYKQVLDPVSHSLGLTATFAILPLLVLLQPGPLSFMVP
jgi:hypothetical protein